MNTKAQTMFMIGIALLVMSGILIYVSLSSPGVYTEAEATTQSSEATESSDSDAIAKTTQATQAVSSVGYPINLNTATVEQLTSIDGLGESRASAIIEYREYLGGYSSVEQIKEIRGIGDATYEKLAPYLTV